MKGNTNAVKARPIEQTGQSHCSEVPPTLRREPYRVPAPANVPRKQRFDSGVHPMPNLREEDEIEMPYTKLTDFVDNLLDENPDQSFCFLDLGSVRSKARVLREHFLPNDPRRAIAYAVKANPRRRILGALMAEGVNHFDCASIDEIERVKKINPSATILYNHPVKSQTDIRTASRSGVRHFTAQTQREVEKIFKRTKESTGEKIEIAARLQTHNEQAAINLSSKFGAPAEEVARMIRLTRDQLGEIPGISIHTGSQNSDVHIFTTAISYMTDIAEHAGGVSTMNVGGGIPISYFPHQKYDMKEYLDTISRVLIREASRGLKSIHGKDPMIAIELGRATVAEAVDLVIPLISREERERPTIYFNDGVFTSFSDFPIHGWRYQFKPYRPSGKPFSPNTKAFILHGRTCDSGDTLGEVHLPEDIDEGDYIWVSNAGAYMDSQSTEFNGFKKPKYVIYNH